MSLKCCSKLSLYGVSDWHHVWLAALVLFFRQKILFYLGWDSWVDIRSRWASATDHSDVSHVEVRRRKLAFFPHINPVVSCQRGCCFPSPPQCGFKCGCCCCCFGSAQVHVCSYYSEWLLAEDVSFEVVSVHSLSHVCLSCILSAVKSLLLVASSE